MLPNLDRIPGTGDRDAGRDLARAPAVIDDAYLQTLDERARLRVGRYGIRQVTVALRIRDPEILRLALLAEAISAAADDGDDKRDIMVGLALHHFCAQQLGVTPSRIFNEVGDRLAKPSVRGLFRTFGSRSDITLDSFAWKLVDTPEGPDFEPIR